MSKRDKLLADILSGQKDNNIPFDALCALLELLGFVCRVRGSHHIFVHPNMPEIVNIQPKGAKAKPYQVKQARELIVKYHLGGGDHVQL